MDSKDGDSCVPAVKMVLEMTAVSFPGMAGVVWGTSFGPVSDQYRTSFERENESALVSQFMISFGPVLDQVFKREIAGSAEGQFPDQFFISFLTFAVVQFIILSKVKLDPVLFGRLGRMVMVAKDQTATRGRGVGGM